MVTLETLKSILLYNPETGLFTRRINRRRFCAGGVAGCIEPDGYVRIKIGQHKYKAHRLAWLHMTGAWPINDIDHIDMNRSNNRFSNLREATRSQNKANARAQSNNKSGFKGVSFDKRTGKWVAYIKYDGKNKNLGYFADPREAQIAYSNAATREYGEFARVR